MTRETKIALLVGLGFIICFGVILSEARTGGPDPVVQLPVNPDPFDSLTAVRRSPAPIVPVARISPPLDIAGSVETHAAYPPVESTPLSMPMGSSPVVPVASPTPPAAPRAPAMPTYTVASGDSLYRIAQKVYGPGHEGQYLRIYEANRDVLTDPENVVVGQALRIPPLSEEARGGSAAGVAVMDEQELRQYLGSPAPAPAGSRSAGRSPAGRSYTVQRGDTLTSIAVRTLGDNKPATIRKLHQANRSKLADPDRLLVGEVLTIPG